MVKVRPARSRPLHPALALAGAAALHALVLTLALRQRSPSPPEPPRAPSAELEYDVSVVEPAVPEAAHAEDRAASAPARPAPTAERAPRRSGERASGETATAPEAAEILVAPPDAEGESAGVAPRARPRVDLGLGGGIARELLLEGRKSRRQAPRVTAGRLAEELDARDAARGLGRSAPAIQAAYRAAAAHAPPLGTAVFDVRADRSGQVISVTLVSFGAEEARWRRVGEALQAQLRRRRLRVRPGAGGMSSLLRIERGELARAPADRDRTRRKAALGQDSLGPKDLREESTRASLEPGSLSPSAGTGTGGGSGHPTRVVLLRERAL